MSSKGFFNLNRFKSSKAIKQQTKRGADNNQNKSRKSRKGDR